MFRHFLILYLMDCFKGDRSSSAVFHLLKGKQTSQTIQDGFTYNVQSFFKGLPTLSREEMEADLTMLQRKGWVQELGTNQVGLTKLGKEELNRLHSIYQLPEGLNGWNVGAVSEIFWSRLSLIVQTVSHLLHGIKSFIPVTSNPTIQEWGRQYFVNSSKTREEIGQALLTELETLLKTRPALQQTVFVHRLSGFQKEGVTFDQLSHLLNKEKEELLLNLKASVEACVTTILDDLGAFPFLGPLIDHKNEIRMTKSAEETFIWFKKGYAIEKISELRGLKLSTIQDHFIEIARVTPKEVQAQLIPPSFVQRIENVLEVTPTRRLSEIKKQLPEDISYFHIRLVVAIQEVLTHA